MKYYNGYRYKVQTNGNMFEVYEKSSSSSIFDFDNYDEAKDMAFQLDQGTGFDGYTPNFFKVSMKPALASLWASPTV